MACTRPTRRAGEVVIYATTHHTTRWDESAEAWVPVTSRRVYAVCPSSEAAATVARAEREGYGDVSTEPGDPAEPDRPDDYAAAADWAVRGARRIRWQDAYRIGEHVEVLCPYAAGPQQWTAAIVARKSVLGFHVRIGDRFILDVRRQGDIRKASP